MREALLHCAAFFGRTRAAGGVSRLAGARAHSCMQCTHIDRIQQTAIMEAAPHLRWVRMRGRVFVFRARGISIVLDDPFCMSSHNITKHTRSSVERTLCGAIKATACVCVCMRVHVWIATYCTTHENMCKYSGNRTHTHTHRHTGIRPSMVELTRTWKSSTENINRFCSRRCRLGYIPLCCFFASIFVVVNHKPHALFTCTHTQTHTHIRIICPELYWVLFHLCCAVCAVPTMLPIFVFVYSVCWLLFFFHTHTRPLIVGCVVTNRMRVCWVQHISSQVEI